MFQICSFCLLISFCFNLCQCLDEAWYSYQKTTKYANREELVVTNITAETVFPMHKNITKWKSLTIGPTCYSIGLLDTGLHILTTVLNKNKNGFDIDSKEIDLENKPSDIILLHHRENGVSEMLIIVSFYNKPGLKWIKMSQNHLDLHFWNWHSEVPVCHINTFILEQKQVLLLIENAEENPVAYLYGFDLKTKPMTYWHMQSLNLSTSANTSAFNKFESDVYLSIPQQSLDSVYIYKYLEHHFILHKRIDSPNLTMVTSFRIGFKSYLAIDGFKAAIFEFSKNGLVDKKITNSHLDGIYFWLPVPVQNYRDEVILFAQRMLDHGSHVTYVVDVITNNGDNFEEHEDIPCTSFEEKSPWLTCLTHENGIIGASYISVGEKLGLIVPRPENGTFVLYMIHSTIKQMPNPKISELKKLQELREKLQELIDEQNEEYEELQRLQPNSARDITDSSDFQVEDNILAASQPEDIEKQNNSLQNLGLRIQEAQERISEIKKIENRTEFDTITVLGEVKFEGDLVIQHANIERINGDMATELLQDIVRKNNINRVLRNKTFSDMEVDSIDFETINDINATNIVYKEPEIIFNGDVIFEKPVVLSALHLTTGKVNDINLAEEIIDIQKAYNGHLEFEEIRIAGKLEAKKINHLVLRLNNTNDIPPSEDTDSIFIPQNVTVKFINGESFEDFLNSLCLVNVKCYIPGNTTVIGGIIAEEAYTDFLNGLKFPDEFILRDSISHANITGRKDFKRSLTAKEVRTAGTIDGIDTEQLVTLTTNQEIPGKLIFKDIELKEELNVTGKILGAHIDKFIPNPTLEVTHFIKTNVNFKNIEVEGNIILEDHFNGQNFEGLLNDFVYADEESANITGTKHFSKGLSVQGNLDIESNSINNVNLNSLVTKDTDQDLHMRHLNGAVTINDLIVLGTFNGKNITQLDESLVKLTGEQFIESTLIFNDDVHVDKLEIVGKLNDLEASEYLYTSGDVTIDNDIVFENIIVDNMLVKGDLNGNISNFDLRDIHERYLSYTKDQSIDTDFHVESATVENLKAETINGMNFAELFDEDSFIRNVTQLLNDGTIKVKILNVNGSIQTDTVNNRKLSDILPGDILRNSAGELKKNLVFGGDVYFTEVEIEKLSSIPWNDFVEQIVFKNETDVVFKGTKLFNEGIVVEKLIETEKINNVRLANILSIEGEQIIRGPITIKGDVFFEDLNVLENVDDVPLGDILNFLIYHNGTYIYQGDMVFERLVHIKNLSIHGTVNDEKIDDFFEDVVLTQGDTRMTGEIIFKKPVNITGNLVVKSLNGLNITDIGSKIVLTTDDAEISGPVAFSKPIVMKQNMKIRKDLSTNYLRGFSTDVWLDRAVFLDRGFLKGHYTFEDVTINDDLVANFINDMNMSRIIPLRSNQTIDYLEFGEVTSVHDINVGNFVNGFKLPEEFENTIMADLDQEIFGNIILKNNIVIRGNLTTATINSKNASKIVTTHTDQNLTASYNFNAKCTLDSGLEVLGSISGINMTAWANESLKIVSNKPQNVDKDWHISENLTFTDDVFSDSLINGLNLSLISEEVNLRRNYKYTYESAVIDDYNNLCTDVTYLYEKAKTQIYKFKYFEDLQELSFAKDLKYVFYFAHENSSYLLVNEDCLSHLLEFNGTKFNKISKGQPTGLIEQVVAVWDDNDLYLVIRGPSEEQKCTKKTKSLTGTVMWKFENTSLQFVNTLENQELLQESLVPGTFYGISKEEVIEFKILKNFSARKYRKWIIQEDNAAFMPRGLKTGLSLRTGEKIVYLDRTEPVIENDMNDIDVESIIRGTVDKANNHFIPGRNGGDIAVLNVGMKNTRKSLLAVATHEETIIKGRLDLIKIYEDVRHGELFDKVPTYKPSSLLSIEFDQGETLLAFIENKRTLRIFEYKGIEGFKHRTSVKLPGSQIFQMTLPIRSYLNPRKVIGIINKNKIRLIQAVMDGNKIRDDMKCEL
ncbi:unnamed protein product [Phaedon cochleariae]|uniref:Uncharacterized protein n=1 Tax=Phaedon cochleariae TaxID=80249 RepID=A0A9N9X0H5_PHACE|nr:unnamed protein product [Phaedon cochleariae]